MDSIYEAAYKELNNQQKQAVDTISGPVLVVAGPGTGKTQLLSVRVGAILQKDPSVLPSNILCLTFTDAAASNLRERLIDTVGLGQEAYHVAIHTFNSFGAWIMSTYPEYFFAWREAATADELTSYRILEGILAKLPGNHPLAGQGTDGTFYALRQVQSFISDCKRNNLLPDEVRQVLIANQRTYDALEPILNEHWPQRMTDKNALAGIHACIEAFRSFQAEEPVSFITPISTLIREQLFAAAQTSAELPPRSQTKPFTAWKDTWLALNRDRAWCFTARTHTEKLLAAADMYSQYQQILQDRGLVDFNDQIVTVLAALRDHEELRLQLQERFQYIMIDEYQDTNRSQLQMAQYLTDAAVHEGRPNILVVGDDDQAIYRFQGADMSNIAAFEKAYEEPVIISLIENYRSNQDIISPARHVSTQIELSLEKQKGISKDLRINTVRAGAGTELYELPTDAAEYSWVASRIKALLDSGKRGSDIAILARKRSQLDGLVPYLRDQQIPMDYERRENVLEQEHVVLLIALARLIHLLSVQELEQVNTLVPEIISHPMWGIEPVDIWKVARQAHAGKRFWLDIIFEQEDTELRRIADFWLSVSQQAPLVPVEHVLDTLLGQIETSPAEDEQQDFMDDRPMQLATSYTSPFKRYHFGDDLFDKRPGTYLTMLSHLACLRRHIRNYQQGVSEQLHLADLIDFVDTYKRTGLTMIDTAAHREDNDAVRLMTAHKAKGLEFDTVFVIGTTDSVWGRNVGSNNSRFSYPQNLREIKPSDNDSDDSLRLLFVAMTRAKQTLYISYHKQSEDSKTQQLFAPLIDLETDVRKPEVTLDKEALVAQHEQRWLQRHASVSDADKHALLADRLEHYQLSATHINNFLDVTRGGPLYFLTQNLLLFPSSLSPSAAYGVAIHKTLQHAHEQVSAGKHPTIPALIAYFVTKLQGHMLSEYDYARYEHKGRETLQTYLKHALPDMTPKQKVEVDFAQQGVTVGPARLKGKLDRMDFDFEHEQVIISDYKTGAAYTKWTLPPSSQDYERVKLHHFKRQMQIYKILVDGSASWGAHGWRTSKGIIRFVEPDTYTHAIKSLELEYDTADMQRTRSLIQVIWQHIMELNFPDTSEKYSNDLAGIEAFEQDLLDGKI